MIAGIGAGAAALAVGLSKAFKSMKESAKAQHEVDQAEFADRIKEWQEMNAIEIRNLSKSFRGMYAVDHLSMTARACSISSLPARWRCPF